MWQIKAPIVQGAVVVLKLCSTCNGG